MKRYKFLAALAVVILAIGSLAVAQEGYYGQQATTNQPAQQTETGMRLVACACGHMHSDATAAMRSFALPAAPESSKSEHSKHGQKVKDGSSASQSEGDPTAVQNRVEYGGGA